MQSKLIQSQASVEKDQPNRWYLKLENVNSQLDENSVYFTINWDDYVVTDSFNEYGIQVIEMEQRPALGGHYISSQKSYYEKLPVASFNGHSRSFTFYTRYHIDSIPSRLKYEIKIYRLVDQQQGRQLSILAYPKIELVNSKWQNPGQITVIGSVLDIPDVELGYSYVLNLSKSSDTSAHYARYEIGNKDMAMVEVGVTSLANSSDIATIDGQTYPSENPYVFKSKSSYTIVPTLDWSEKFPNGLTVFKIPMYNLNWSTPNQLGYSEESTFKLNGTAKNTFDFKRANWSYIQPTPIVVDDNVYIGRTNFYSGANRITDRRFRVKNPQYYRSFYFKNDILSNKINIEIQGGVTTSDLHKLEFGSLCYTLNTGELQHQAYSLFNSGTGYNNTSNGMRLNKRVGKFTESQFSNIASKLGINDLSQIFSVYKMDQWEIELYHYGHGPYDTNACEPWETTNHNARLRLYNVFYSKDINESQKLQDINYVKLLKQIFLRIYWLHTREHNDGSTTESGGSLGILSLYDLLTLSFTE
jgi:hypothetical protein